MQVRPIVLHGLVVRVYDRAHLARHPDQVVTAVKLLVKQKPSAALTSSTTFSYT